MTHVPLELIIASAQEHGIEPGWLWLYLNGFKRRVPSVIREKIQRDVLGLDETDPHTLHLALAWQQRNAKEEEVGKE